MQFGSLIQKKMAIKVYAILNPLIMVTIGTPLLSLMNQHVHVVPIHSLYHLMELFMFFTET